MEQQRFASLTGRARQWLPPEEFEPELRLNEPARVGRAKALSATSKPLASLGDLVRYKRARPRPGR